jgi:quinone-modifying oxidoreductase subunit QmoC
MASIPLLAPSTGVRAKLEARGGESAARCYQCATCSSVCDLAPAAAPFPRQQMLWAQWGLIDKLAADPGVWLCHQCNECNVRCPRDAQPGDVMQSLRSAVVEHVAMPSFLGKLVGNIKASWPLLVLGPIVFWLVLLAAYTGLHIPHVNPDLPAVEGRFHYEEVVPHLPIYVVYTTVSAWVALALFVSGSKLWKLYGANVRQRGPFFGNLWSVVVDIATHKQFDTCGEGSRQRRWGHFLVMWGFVGAAVTSGILVVYLYKEYPPFSWIPLDAATYPLPITHWVKWLGNISAVALVVGGVLLYLNRLQRTRQAGATTAFDRFFLMTVLGVIGTGVFTEAMRFVAVPPIAASAMYVLHLGAVLTLFMTVPYSKFAHLAYRTVALVHQRAVEKS